MPKPSKTTKDFTPNKMPPKVSVTASAVKPSPSRRPKKTTALRLKARVPAKSISKAKAVFKSFNLSKFAGKELPPNYVAAGKDHKPVQKRGMLQKLSDLKGQPNPNAGMTIALPTASFQQVLPKLNQKAKTIDLTDLMTFVQQNMRGTQFFANGNATLNRLSIRSQVQRILGLQKEG